MEVNARVKNRRSHSGSPWCESRSLKPIARGVALSLVLSLWVGGAGAASAARWVMTDLTPGASYAAAHLINNRGQVGGGVGERLFVWENGKLTYLSVAGESASARAMNDRGQIVGWTSAVRDETGFVVQQAVVWAPGGKRTLLPGGPATAAAINEKGLIAGNADSGVVTWSGERIRRLSTPRAPNGSGPVVAAVNAAGDIIGNATMDYPGPHGRVLEQYGFIRRAAKWVLVGASKRKAQVNGLNDPGQVVGWRGRATLPGFQAFLWQHGKMTILDAPPGIADASTTAIAINNRGQIAGEAVVDSGDYPRSHGVIWEKGTATALGSLFRGGESYVKAISEGGRVVGWSFHRRTRREQAFIWEAGRLTNLGAAHCLSSRALAINDRGQAVGTCEKSKGRSHAVLWTLRRD